MKTIVKTLAASAALATTLTQPVLASGGGALQIPEPGSLALVGVAIAAAVVALRRKK